MQSTVELAKRNQGIKKVRFCMNPEIAQALGEHNGYLCQHEIDRRQRGEDIIRNNCPYHEHTRSTYGHINHTYGQSRPNYGRHSPNYSQCILNYGQSSPNYGRSSPNYGRNSPNYTRRNSTSHGPRL